MIEDNAELREYLRVALEIEGCHALTAADGKQALKYLDGDGHQVDAVVTDLFMPENDGFEAIDRFRKEFPATKIVVMSGDAKRAKLEYLPVAELIGVDATLKKPFRLQELFQKLRTLDA